jgi:hypothetical protein
MLSNSKSGAAYAALVNKIFKEKKEMCVCDKRKALNDCKSPEEYHLALVINSVIDIREALEKVRWRLDGIEIGIAHLKELLKLEENCKND